MITPRHITWLMLLAVILGTLSPLPSLNVSAQETGIPTINLSAGAFFEILAETDIEDASVSYVLSQERAFLSASRDPLFRYRFLTPGTYFLTGELVSADGSRSHRRDIQIQVIPREAGSDDVIPEKSASQQPGAVVDTLPLQARDGAVALEPHGLVRFLPVQRDLQSIALDLDVTKDANGDGDPGNDNQSAGTELGSASRALYLWFVDVETPRTMRIAAKRTNDEVLTQSLRLVRPGEEASPQTTVPDAPPLTPPSSLLPIAGGITSQVHPDGSVRFSVSLRDPLPIDVPYLYEWNFGDASKSLLEVPLHTYAKPGIYTVELRIVDLRTFEERMKLRSDVQVATTGGTAEPREPKEGKELKESKERQGGGGFGGIILTILKLLGVLLLCAAIGAAIMFLISKFKGKKLADGLEAAEKKLVGEIPKEVEEAPAPMEITAEEVIEIPEEEAPPPEPEAVTLPFEALKGPQALSGSPVEGQPESEPSPPAPSASPSDLPEWLRTEGQPHPSVGAVQPPPPVTPIPPSEPPAENVHHDAFVPTPAQLAVDETTAPSWLTQGLEGAKAEGQTVTAPPPPELANHPKPPPPPPLPPPPPPPPPPPSPSVQPHPSAGADLTPEDKERLKKKRKRQRYRENLKKRREAEPHPSVGAEPDGAAESDEPSDDSSDEPIAIIRADSLTTEPPPEEDTDTKQAA